MVDEKEIVAEINRLMAARQAKDQELGRISTTPDRDYASGYLRALRDVWKFIDPSLGMPNVKITGLGIIAVKPDGEVEG